MYLAATDVDYRDDTDVDCDGVLALRWVRDGSDLLRHIGRRGLDLFTRNDKSTASDLNTRHPDTY